MFFKAIGENLMLLGCNLLYYNIYYIYRMNGSLYQNIIKTFNLSDTKYNTVSDKLNEVNLMSIIFSKFSSDTSYTQNNSKYIKYILKNDNLTSVDMNALIENTYFYYDKMIIIWDKTDNYIPSKNEKIIDFDVSYYSSFNVTNYFFYLDFISEIYRNIQDLKFNKKSLTVDEMNISCRYYYNDDGTLVLYTANSTGIFNIKLNIFRNEKNMNQVVDITINSNVRIQQSFNLFKTDILKHLNYLSGPDVIVSGNINYLTVVRNFYQLCRLKLMHMVLQSIDLLSDTISNDMKDKITTFIKEYAFPTVINYKTHVSLEDDILNKKSKNNYTSEVIDKSYKLKKINNTINKQKTVLERNRKVKLTLKQQHDKTRIIDVISKFMIGFVIIACTILLIHPKIDSTSRKLFSIILTLIIVILYVFIYVFIQPHKATEYFVNKSPSFPAYVLAKNFNFDANNKVIRADGSSSYKNNKNFFQAFDNNKDTFWQSGKGTYNAAGEALVSNRKDYAGEVLKIDLGEYLKLTSFTFEFNKLNNLPKDFRIYGSDDHSFNSWIDINNSDWEMISEHNNVVYAGTSKNIEVTTSRSYKYLAIIVRKIYISDTNSPSIKTVNVNQMAYKVPSDFDNSNLVDWSITLPYRGYTNTTETVYWTESYSYCYPVQKQGNRGWYTISQCDPATRQKSAQVPAYIHKWNLKTNISGDINRTNQTRTKQAASSLIVTGKNNLPDSIILSEAAPLQIRYRSSTSNNDSVQICVLKFYGSASVKDDTSKTVSFTGSSFTLPVDYDNKYLTNWTIGVTYIGNTPTTWPSTQGYTQYECTPYYETGYSGWVDGRLVVQVAPYWTEKCGNVGRSRPITVSGYVHNFDITTNISGQTKISRSIEKSTSATPSSNTINATLNNSLPNVIKVSNSTNFSLKYHPSITKALSNQLIENELSLLDPISAAMASERLLVTAEQDYQDALIDIANLQKEFAAQKLILEKNLEDATAKAAIDNVTYQQQLAESNAALLKSKVDAATKVAEEARKKAEAETASKNLEDQRIATQTAQSTTANLLQLRQNKMNLFADYISASEKAAIAAEKSINEDNAYKLAYEASQRALNSAQATADLKQAEFLKQSAQLDADKAKKDEETALIELELASTLFDNEMNAALIIKLQSDKTALNDEMEFQTGLYNNAVAAKQIADQDLIEAKTNATLYLQQLNSDMNINSSNIGQANYEMQIKIAQEKANKASADIEYSKQVLEEAKYNTMLKTANDIKEQTDTLISSIENSITFYNDQLDKNTATEQSLIEQKHGLQSQFNILMSGENSNMLANADTKLREMNISTQLQINQMQLEKVHLRNEYIRQTLISEKAFQDALEARTNKEDLMQQIKNQLDIEQQILSDTSFNKNIVDEDVNINEVFKDIDTSIIYGMNSSVENINTDLFLPKLNREYQYFDKYKNEFNNAAFESNTDKEISILDNDSTDDGILFILNISLSICVTMVFYNYYESITATFGLWVILLIICITYYILSYMSNVRTKAKNYYWGNPSMSSRL
jgi:hypothetical protein